MGNFKRSRPKNRRAGCLMCKPRKMNGAKRKRPVREMRWSDLEDAWAKSVMARMRSLNFWMESVGTDRFNQIFAL